MRLLAPQFELVAHTEQYRLLLNAHRTAVAGGDADATVAVQLQMGGRADQLLLQQAHDALGVGLGHDVVADPLPFRLCIQPQAAGFERVVGQHETVVAGARDEVAVSGGNRHAPFIVNCDGRLALEHDACTYPSPGETLNHENPQNTRISL
ncbi:hypothetical protein SprV_0502034400 [Sparganum proliferum]